MNFYNHYIKTHTMVNTFTEKLMKYLGREKTYSVKIFVTVGSTGGSFEVDSVGRTKAEAEENAKRLIETSVDVKIIRSHVKKGR